MAIRSFSDRKRLHSLVNFLLHKTQPQPQPQIRHCFTSQPEAHANPALPDLVNEISRILSDYRNPHHDLEFALNAFCSIISTDFVEQVLKRCKNLGFSAHRFFLWAKAIPGFQHSPKSYYILIDILGSSKQFAILWDFLTEIKDNQSCEITPEIFWIIFRAYSRANLPGDAIRAFSRMKDFGVKPSINDLDQLLHILCKRKHVKSAQLFFDKVKTDFTPSVKTYSILVRGWGEIGEPREARKVFDAMLEKKCSVDVLAYNSLLDALCKGEKVEEAYKMFKEMRLNGTEPDAFSYAIFIHAYCEANDIHSVFRVLDTMKRYSLIPNVFTYNCVIKKLCKTDKVEEAYQLLDEMIENGANPDTWSYNAILAYHCEHGEVNMALRLISKMVKDKCTPDRHTYNMVLKLLIRVGRFDRATEVWESMGESGFYPSVSTYSVMVHGLCKKKGKLEDACKYFEMMVDEGIPPYMTTVELLRNRLIGHGFVNVVEILAEKMERSSSCSIKEMVSVMRGNRGIKKSRGSETDFESD